MLGVWLPGLVLSVYWLHGLLHLLLDLSCWPPLYRYKLQPGRPLQPARLPRLLATVAAVQLFVFLPVCGCLALLSVHTELGLQPDPALPSSRTLFLHLLGYAVSDEVFFYLAHRAAHHPGLYRHVHKVGA